MTKALVYHNQYGPAQIYFPPSTDSALPEAASIPGGPFPRASSQVAARGHAIPWDRWAEHLSEQLPYFDSWTVEDVPDGLSPQDALSLVRSRNADNYFSEPSG